MENAESVYIKKRSTVLWVERLLQLYAVYCYAVNLEASSRTSASESLEWRTVNSMLMPSASKPLANSIFFSFTASLATFFATS